MLLADFDFTLPPELIAQHPLAIRSSSRLLCLDRKTGSITHHCFKELSNLFAPQDLLVLNNTKVIPARLYAHKPTGGKAAILIERILDDHRLLAQIKTSKKLAVGSKLLLTEESWFVITHHHQNLFELRLHSHESLNKLLEKFGQLPLPPYIKRNPNLHDQTQYQTIYAKFPGAIAAPTAGLHFDHELFQQLQQQKIQTTFITLHVALGTFQPVRVEKIKEHQMHAEYLEVSESTCNDIIATKKNGGKIIAVGTTTVRALETATQSGVLQPYQEDTNIFIFPGYSFRSIDCLITNFHLPKTSLLMLVAAFAGYENTMNAYQEAIKHRYRFYSYGDAMMII